MSTLADYQGRRYDVLALRGGTAVGNSQLSQSLFDANSAGEICVGLQKLSQRWALEFLTEVGSIRYKPTRGCEFMIELQQGRLLTEAAVGVAFRFANLDIAANLQGEEDSSWPDDERFSGATLDALTILPGSLQLTVTITSRAGSTALVILPINYIPA